MTRPTAEQLAHLADVILDLAHKLDIRHPDLRGVVPLTGAEIAVIREVHRHPHSTPTQIAELTGMQRSNVSTVVRALEAGGLIRREQVPDNARSVTLVPTATAEAHVERIHQSWAGRLSGAPEGALEDAVEALDALTQVAAALGRT